MTPPKALPAHPSDPIPIDDPPWLVEAGKILGLKEIHGPKNEQLILDAHALTTLHATDDETAWCSSIMNWLMKKAGQIYTRSAAARSWLKWGRKLNKPIRGCVVVFWRGGSRDADDDGPGHVALYLGPGRPGYIRVRGGNQSDMFCDAQYKEADVLGYRWPSSYPLPH